MPHPDGVNLDPDRIAQELSERGKAWAEAEAAAAMLEETRRPLRSQLAAEYLREGEAGNRAEMMAEADPAYQSHVESMVLARKEANIARVRYKTFEAWIDMKRTNAATERALMQLGG